MFAGLMAAALIQALTAAAGAWCVQHLFDELIGGPNAGDHDLRLIGGGFAGAALLGFLLEIVQRRLGEGLGLDYTADVRLALFDHHLNAPAARLGRRSQGAILLPFVGDLTALKQWVSSGLARMSAALVTVIVLLVIVSTRNLLLGASLASAMVIGGAVLLALGRPLDSAVREVRRRRGALAGFVSGRLAAVAAIQVMGRSRSEQGKVIVRTEALNLAGQRRAWITGGMRGIAQLTGSLLILATLLSGMHEIGVGRLTPGEVVGALSLVALLATAMHDVARGLEMWPPARTSRERISDALRQPTRHVAAGRPAQRPRTPGLIIDALEIAPILSKVSASAGPGDVVLIEGDAGSGKSTLLGCIAQIVEPTTGAISYRGRNLQSLSSGNLKRALGFASPALPLLRGSLMMNLRYRKPAAGVDEISSLISGCGLERLLARLPRHLEGRLSDNGANLSLGERQSVLLARALLGSPTILLLDSVDSHLDPPVVEWLAETLRNYRGIVLMTASRAKITSCATQVWRLEGGRLSSKPAKQRRARSGSLPKPGADEGPVRSIA